MEEYNIRRTLLQRQIETRTETETWVEDSNKDKYEEKWTWRNTILQRHSQRDK